MTVSAQLVFAGHAIVVAVHLGAGAVFQEVRGFGAGGHLCAIARLGELEYSLLTRSRPNLAAVFAIALLR